MKGFKKCSNGHYYKEDLDVCPYCPAGSENNSDKTKTFENEESGSFVKTSAFNDNDATKEFEDSNKTKTFDDDSTKTKEFDSFNKTTKSGKTEIFGGNNISPDFDPTKTQIHIEPDEGEKGTSRAARKIVGWLISYTVNEMGMDYRIYEGRNLMGASPKCDITIGKDVDMSISSEHLLILVRGKWIKIQDNLSTNGTFINGEEIEPGVPQKLNDGDQIKIGDNLFFFRTALKDFYK